VKIQPFLWQIRNSPVRLSTCGKLLNRKASILTIILGVLGAAAGSAQAQTDLEKMKANVLSFHTGANANATDPYVISARNGVGTQGNSMLNSMNPNGSWSDINYASAAVTGRVLKPHYSRIRDMAQAYRTPGHSLYQDSRLTNAVEKALQFGQTYVHVGCSRPDNWWDWEIGIPNQLSPTLFLLQGHISSALFQASRDTLSYLIYPTPHLTGQNLIWSATNHMYLALLDNDPARMVLVKNAFQSQCAVQSGEGIQSDYSFHQHGPQLYNGGYGEDFSQFVSWYMIWAAGTSYQVNLSGLDTFARYGLDGSAWMVYDNVYEPACRGREITRGNVSRDNVLYSLLVLAIIPNSRQAEATALAKRQLQIRNDYDLGRAAMAEAVLQSPISPAGRLGHKHFWQSDFTVHYRPNYFVSLKMFSNRVLAGENVGDEGKKAWHLSDGLTWMLLDYSDYYTSDVLPTLEWNRLPGTTVERKTHAPGAGLDLGVKSFVGGAWASNHGASAMDFAANDSDLTALKSWFFFDQEIVCLGSAITCPSDNRVETTVNQRCLKVPTATLTVDGIVNPAIPPWNGTLTNITWAHCEGFGYYFPGRSTIQAQRQVQQGSWYDLNSYIFNSRDVKSNPILTIWFDHGVRPAGKEYAYAVLPNQTAAAMTVYAANPPISILAHNDRVHAVKHRNLNAVGAVFWAADAVDKVWVDTPCIVYYEESGGSFKIALSEPSHVTKTIFLTIGEPLAPSRLPSNVTAVLLGGKTFVSFRVKDGENTVAEFVRMPSAAKHWEHY
jgi:chondroitin AC lyase